MLVPAAWSLQAGLKYTPGNYQVLKQTFKTKFMAAGRRGKKEFSKAWFSSLVYKDLMASISATERRRRRFPDPK